MLNSERDRLANEYVRVVRFYTNESQPLDTMKKILFKLEFENVGFNTAENVVGTLCLGDREQQIGLGRLTPGQRRTINLELTNNISDQLSKIGVKISNRDTSEAFKHYTWNGVMDVRMGKVERDTTQELFWSNGNIRGNYKVYIANYGTKFVKGAKVMIQADGDSIGTATVDLEPRRLTTVTFPVEVKNGGSTPLRFRVFHRNESNTNVLLAHGDNTVSVDSHNTDVELVSITSSKSIYSQGETAVVQYIVRNNTGIAVNNLVVEFRNNGSLMGSSVIEGVLSPGKSAIRKLNINNTSVGGGSMNLEIKLDPKRKISDKERSNNRKVKILQWKSNVVVKPLGAINAVYPTKVETGVSFVVEGFCDNAHNTTMSIDGDNLTNYTGINFKRTISIASEGVHVIEINARNTANGTDAGAQLATKKIQVTVTKNSDDNNVLVKQLGIFTVNCPTEVEAGTLFEIEGSCINAHHTAISIDGKNWTNHVGTKFTRQVVLNTAGNYTIEVKARNTENENQIGTETDSRKVHIVATKSQDDHQVKVNNFLEFALNDYRNGVAETGGNITPYGKWYGLDGQAWCAMFVSYCADKAELLNNTVPRYASSTAGKNWYVEQGRYHKSSSDYEPKAGDVFFFTRKNTTDQISHTGIVAAYDPKNKIIYTVEGNISDKVSSRKFRLHTLNFQGYGSNGGKTNGSPIATAYWGKDESTQ